MHCCAVVPARCGSKSIKDKNIQPIGGKPLLAWSIEQALAAKLVTRTIVSTDSAAYADIARQYGAETPFCRPPEISDDEATDLEVFEHALDWLQKREGYVPDICVHLRPTHPVRTTGIIDDCVQFLIDHPEVDSVRTVTEVSHPPFKMWYRDSCGMLAPVVAVEGIAEPWNMPRQKLPCTYLQTANVDVVRTSVILNQHSMTGKRIYGYLQSDFHDIDTVEELAKAALALETSVASTPGKNGVGDAKHKTFCFDIDGVIATLTLDNDYSKAGPQRNMIEMVNRLYDTGHRIILFTARGSVTGINWENITAEQMRSWGVKYHELRFGKPAADYYVDDRTLGLEDIGKLLTPVVPHIQRKGK